MKLSLVVPCYNEDGNVTKFYQATKKAFMDKKYDYEIVFVNDGSRDQTYSKLKELLTDDTVNIKIINFSRNYGKEAAVLAGLKNSNGDLVTIIDADLQQKPEVVIDMVDLLDEHPEYDCVAAYQQDRIEGKFISSIKNLFYSLINKVCEIDFHNGASDFRTFRRNMVEAILSMPEYFRFSKGIFSWVGFETFFMPYTAEERYSGETKWSFIKLIKYAFEGFISFTTFPLRVATFLGIFTSLASIMYLIIIMLQKIIFSIDIPGYATIVCLILFLGGIQLLVLGIIGEYLAKVYIQGKERPIYIIKDLVSNESGEKNV